VNGKATIIAAWVSIIVIVISAVVYVVRIDARLSFLDERIDKIVDLCCDEVKHSDWEHVNLLQRGEAPHPFGGGN